MSVAAPPRATVAISTKNRKDDLRKAMASVMAQTVPAELLILDDGSTDGTADMVRTEFPQARLERSEQSQGYMVQRNRAAKLATGEIIFSLDDDAMMSPKTVEQTLADFDHPLVGGVSIPWIDAINDKRWSWPPDKDQIYATAWYTGTAYALRRDLFLKLGGYYECLQHGGEESELSLRMLNLGYVIRMGTADPIYHYESPKRDRVKQHVFGARNVILITWLTVPMPNFLIHLPGTMFNVLRYRLREGHVMRVFNGFYLGFKEIIRQWNLRKPVTREAYRLYRQLVRRQAVPLKEIESSLRA
jgi:glycosyltransferase involved in cell wall biosynthesis